TSYPVPRTSYLVPCTLYLVPCTLYLVPCTLYLVPRTLYLVPRTLYLVPRTLYLIPCISYLCIRPSNHNLIQHLDICLDPLTNFINKDKFICRVRSCRIARSHFYRRRR